MASSVSNIVRNLEEMPLQLARRFADSLASLTNQFVARAYGRARQERHQREDATVSASADSKFKKSPHILPDWLSGKGKDIVPKDVEDKPAPKPRLS